MFSCEAFIADDELPRADQVAAESPEVAGMPRQGLTHLASYSYSCSSSTNRGQAARETQMYITAFCCCSSGVRIESR